MLKLIHMYKYTCVHEYIYLLYYLYLRIPDIWMASSLLHADTAKRGEGGK